MADTEVSPLVQRLLTPHERAQLDERQFKCAYPAARDTLACLARLPRGDTSSRREELDSK